MVFADCPESALLCGGFFWLGRRGRYSSLQLKDFSARWPLWLQSAGSSLQAQQLRCPASWLWGVWNLSRPGINPMPVPSLAGRFLPIDPPGKSFLSLTFDSFNTCVLEKVFCIETFTCPIIIPLWMCAFGSFPDLGNSQAIVSMHNLSDPFSLSSAFETPSILLTVLVESEVSQRISSLKTNKQKKNSILSSHLPESFYLWTQFLYSIWYPLTVLCNSHFISVTEFFSTRISVYLCLRGFIILETVPYGHYFYSSANWNVFVSFLVACWAYSWHYFELSTCLITVFHNFKLFHGKLPCSFCDSMLLWFFMVFSGLLFCPCIWRSKQFSYVGKALYTLILTIQQIANRGPSMFFN